MQSTAAFRDQRIKSKLAKIRNPTAKGKSLGNETLWVQPRDLWSKSNFIYLHTDIERLTIFMWDSNKEESFLNSFHKDSCVSACPEGSFSVSALRQTAGDFDKKRWQDLAPHSCKSTHNIDLHTHLKNFVSNLLQYCRKLAKHTSSSCRNLTPQLLVLGHLHCLEGILRLPPPTVSRQRWKPEMLSVLQYTPHHSRSCRWKSRFYFSCCQKLNSGSSNTRIGPPPWVHGEEKSLTSNINQNVEGTQMWCNECQKWTGKKKKKHIICYPQVRAGKLCTAASNLSVDGMPGVTPKLMMVLSLLHGACWNQRHPS